MTRPIIDAGPALNFFAITKERLLISILGQLATPATVHAEVLRKAATDKRFTAVGAVLSKLGPKWLEILPDASTVPGLAAAVGRISQLPMHKRLQQAKDLGELMVIAHAATIAETGSDVIVLIDEKAGAALATSEAARLDRLRAQGIPVGAIRLVDTVTVLAKAAGGTHIPTKAAMRDLYSRLRGLDDGLLPIDKTGLLGNSRWTNP